MITVAARSTFSRAHRTRRAPRGGGGRALRGVVGGGVLVVVLAGCGSADAGEAPKERKVFSLAGESLTIDNDDSAIDVIAADVKDVQVTRQIDGWVFIGSGPEASWKMAGDTLTLRVDCDAVASSCESRHTVKVPRGISLTVRDGNGGVTASGFDTPLTIRSGNGDVTVRDTAGALDLLSDNGNVTTERITARTVKAESGNGRVRIGFKNAAPDKVEALTGNGGIRIDLPRAGSPYAVDATSDNGNVTTDVPSDGDSPRAVIARSDNGYVKVLGAG
ncbi:DUF4097 family beta strand repeat-containing protein [Streptomyces katsurahamanus]|uniref:DUF4097 domain-containing protein n=1 Tax=Streptomyces katsurahamanus TaxID=2577098 RepID=A0ABW9NUT2_9ACTN|nr:DUF4097 domain-containing protein [Streptomyces katsurahamanus]